MYCIKGVKCGQLLAEQIVEHETVAMQLVYCVVQIGCITCNKCEKCYKYVSILSLVSSSMICFSSRIVFLTIQLKATQNSLVKYVLTYVIH